MSFELWLRQEMTNANCPKYSQKNKEQHWSFFFPSVEKTFGVFQLTLARDGQARRDALYSKWNCRAVATWLERLLNDWMNEHYQFSEAFSLEKQTVVNFSWLILLNDLRNWDFRPVNFFFLSMWILIFSQLITPLHVHRGHQSVSVEYIFLFLVSK